MPPLIVIFAAVFGAASAAFLPGLAHRFTDGEGGFCATCGQPLRVWARVVPSCSCAGGSARVIPLGAAVSALLALAVGPVPLLPVYLLATVPGLALALSDLRCLRLPNRLVAALAVTTGVPLGLLEPGRIPAALLAGVALVTAYGILAALPRGGLGMGDVKLAGVLGLILGFAGWPAVLVGAIVPHLINGPIALVLLTTGRATRRQALPFGPALLIGALVAITTA